MSRSRKTRHLPTGHAGPPAPDTGGLGVSRGVRGARAHPGPRWEGGLRILPRWAAVLAFLLASSGCASLNALLALRQVEFDLDRVSRIALAGVDLMQVRGYEDLSAADVARLGIALAQGTLPLELTLDLSAANPDGNPEARLLALDWDLFLDGVRTVGGGHPEAVVLPSGEVTMVPVSIRLDLREFFDGGARELVNLAAGLAGLGGEPVAIALEAVPTVDTPIGPIRYPRPLVLGNRGAMPSEVTVP